MLNRSSLKKAILVLFFSQVTVNILSCSASQACRRMTGPEIVPSRSYSYRPSSNYARNTLIRKRHGNHSRQRQKASCKPVIRTSYNHPQRTNYIVDVHHSKQRTTWEAPTKVDVLIDKDIENAQIDYGPTSTQAARLMVKYAKQYLAAGEYAKAKAVIDKALELNNASSIDGLDMNELLDLKKRSQTKLAPQNKKSKPSAVLAQSFSNPSQYKPVPLKKYLNREYSF